jgi:Tfp pilus assembly protein PilO
MTVALLTRIAREKRLVFVPLVVTLLVNVVLAVAVVLPLSRRVAGAETREAQAMAALQIAERDRAAQAATLQTKQQAEQDLGRFYGSILPASMIEARRQTYVRLARLASDADLQSQRRIEELQVPKPAGTGPGPVLTRLEITMVLRGEYDSVRQFIRDVETSEEFITIDHVSLAEGTEPGSPLVLTVVLSTYFKGGAP